MPERLDSRPARTDLTDRECAKILGGLIGSLCLMTTVETVRAAVAHWAEDSPAWAALDLYARTQRPKPTSPKKN